MVLKRMTIVTESDWWADGQPQRWTRDCMSHINFNHHCNAWVLLAGIGRREWSKKWRGTWPPRDDRECRLHSIFNDNCKHSLPYLQDIEYFAAESDIEESENSGLKLDLQDLSRDPHPCLLKGDFSVFNSPNVGLASMTDVTYSLDMDGFVVLSRWTSLIMTI